MSENKIVGVDLSLSSIGVVIRNLSGSKIKEHVLVIDTKKKDKLFRNKMEHYNLICEWVMKLIPESTRLVAIEGYSLQSSGNAVSRMVENGARLRFLLWDKYIPFIEISPQTLKAYATGKPSADKQRVYECMEEHFDFGFITKLESYKQRQKEDLVDACVAADIGVFCLRLDSIAISLKGWDNRFKRKVAMCKRIMDDHYYLNRSQPKLERG